MPPWAYFLLQFFHRCASTMGINNIHSNAFPSTAYGKPLEYAWTPFTVFLTVKSESIVPSNG